MSRSGQPSLEQQLQVWQAGIAHEIAFWTRWIDTRGARWGWEFQRRLDPDATVDAVMAGVIDRIGDSPIRILDVGAGPMTSVGKQYADRKIEVTACDPLADIYRSILGRYGIRPPVATEFAIVEDLNLKYQQGQFSIVHCRNALDHSFDPVRGILRMLSVCRHDGYVLLQHVPNEAENERYEGLHRWNFTSLGQDLVIWNRESSTNASDVISPFAHSETISVDGYVTNLFRKTGEVPDSLFDDDLSRYLYFQRAFVQLCSAVHQ